MVLVNHETLSSLAASSSTRRRAKSWGPAPLVDDEISEEALTGAKEQEPVELVKMIEDTEKSLGLAAAGAKRLRTYWAKSHTLKSADRSDLQRYFAHLVHLEDRQLQLTPQ